MLACFAFFVKPDSNNMPFLIVKYSLQVEYPSPELHYSLHSFVYYNL